MPIVDSRPSRESIELLSERAASGPLAGDLIEVALVVGGCIVFCIVVVGADDVSWWVAKLGMDKCGSKQTIGALYVDTYLVMMCDWLTGVLLGIDLDEVTYEMAADAGVQVDE